MPAKTTAVLSADQLKAKWAADAANAAAAQMGVSSGTESALPEAKDEMASLLDSILADQKIEPLREIIRLYNATREDGSFVLAPDQRVAIMEKLMPYRYPKYKPVAMAQTGPKKVTLVIKNFTIKHGAEGKILDVKSVPLADKRR